MTGSLPVTKFGLPELTMMVNNQNPYMKLFPFLVVPETDDPLDTERFIRNEAVWDLAEIQELASRDENPEQTLIPFTARCTNQLEVLKDNGFDLAQHVQMLSAKHYRQSVWCRGKGSRGRMGPWVPCDDYALKGVAYTHPRTGHSGRCDYYFKFCKSITGTVVLFVSVHTSS